MYSSTDLDVTENKELDPILSGDVLSLLGGVTIPNEVSPKGLAPLPEELGLGERIDFSLYAKPDVKETGLDLGEEESPPL